MNDTNAKQNGYLLLIRGPEWYNGLPADELQQAMDRIKAWFEQLNERGIVKGAQPLVRQGKIVSGRQGRVVADGPFAESKEAIGGYLLLAVDTIEEAVAIARSFPPLDYGTQVEVRPVAEECPMVTLARQINPEAQLANA